MPILLVFRLAYLAEEWKVMPKTPETTPLSFYDALLDNKILPEVSISRFPSPTCLSYCPLVLIICSSSRTWVRYWRSWKLTEALPTSSACSSTF